MNRIKNYYTAALLEISLRTYNFFVTSRTSSAFINHKIVAIGTHQGSSQWRIAGGCLFDWGKNPIKCLKLSIASTSLLKDLWATPETAVCVFAPPNSSCVTSSFVTDWNNLNS